MGSAWTTVPAWDILLVWRSILHGLLCGYLLHHGLSLGLPGNLCTIAWSTSSSSLLSGLGVCKLVSHNYFFSVPHFLCSVLPFLKYVFTEAPPAFLPGSALGSRVPFGANWT